MQIDPAASQEFMVRQQDDHVLLARLSRRAVMIRLGVAVRMFVAARRVLVAVSGRLVGVGPEIAVESEHRMQVKALTAVGMHKEPSPAEARKDQRRQQHAQSKPVQQR